MQTTILVNKSQSSNPLLKSFFFPYTFSSSITADFQINTNTDLYFLSFRYHKQYPSYISTRFLQLNPSSTNYLLFLYDIPNDDATHCDISTDASIQMNINTNMHLLTEDSVDDNLFTMLHMDKDEQTHTTQYDDIERIITDINILCIDKHVTLIIGFTHNELAQDIHAMSIVTNNNNKMKHKHKQHEIGNDDVISTLTCIDNINKTDANNLLLNFKDIVTLSKANESTLSLLPKLSDNKVKMVYSFFNTALN
jgi:hypothetical protein